MPLNGNSTQVYEPIRYILSLGGKRFRPLLVLLAYEMFREDVEKALKPALAVELFHNFTLMHDDIMDKAPLRRGKPTVHEKWNTNTAILSGDIMFVKVYELLEGVDGNKLPEIFKLFNKCAIEVCEGQQLDMDNELRDDVTIDEYLEMIRLKTAVLIGTSLQLGAILADAPPEKAALLKAFGDHLGIGFQLKDDLLDVYGDQQKFGKQVGGDIISNKKTFLLLKAEEMSSGAAKKELNQLLSGTFSDPSDKVQKVTEIYDSLNIKSEAETKMQQYFDTAFSFLNQLELDESKKAAVRNFAQNLIKRDH